MSDYIVKDSSLWSNRSSVRALQKRDTQVRIGMVQKSVLDEKSNTRKYIVEIYDGGNRVPVICMPTSTMGGVYNYEEFAIQGYDRGESEEGVGNYKIRPGDVVVVAYLRGQSKEGVILSFVQQHPAKTPKLTEEDGMAYASEFNGIERTIDKEGAYKVTFKGAPINLKDLSQPITGKPIPKPEYPEETTGSYYEFDKTGSWNITDNAKEKPQSIKVDKATGTITLTSGNIVVKMEKEAEKTSITTKELSIEASDKIEAKTKEYKMDASKSVKIKSAKVAIGADGAELLDLITKLIMKIGTLQPISPIGPCSPLQVASTWPEIQAIQQKIKSITGTL